MRSSSRSRELGQLVTCFVSLFKIWPCSLVLIHPETTDCATSTCERIALSGLLLATGRMVALVQSERHVSFCFRCCGSAAHDTTTEVPCRAVMRQSGKPDSHCLGNTTMCSRCGKSRKLFASPHSCVCRGCCHLGWNHSLRTKKWKAEKLVRRFEVPCGNTIH